LGLKFEALINLEKTVSKIVVRGPYFTTGGIRSAMRQHAQAFEVSESIASSRERMATVAMCDRLANPPSLFEGIGVHYP
jgi:hypothetical protein